ncbi:MAG: heme exporter protein CcmD [Gammaproteobacteria bacterium]|nr:heme exporter protein CcmD [Gammaproteobacteria bacterium]
MTLEEFFYMGGYALYVWSSYGLAFIVMLAIFIGPVMNRKRILKDLRMKYRQQARQKQEN